MTLNKQNRAKRKLQDWNTQNSWACALEEDLNPFFKIEVLENKLTKAILSFESDDLELATIQCQLGYLLCQVEVHEEGLPFLEAALNTFELKLEYDDPVLISWKVVLANIYMEIDEALQASWLLKDCIKVVLLNENSLYPEINTLQWTLVKALEIANLNFEQMELVEEILALKNLLHHYK